jgi:hypothetical protein
MLLKLASRENLSKAIIKGFKEKHIKNFCFKINQLRGARGWANLLLLFNNSLMSFNYNLTHQ